MEESTIEKFIGPMPTAGRSKVDEVGKKERARLNPRKKIIFKIKMFHLKC